MIPRERMAPSSFRASQKVARVVFVRGRYNCARDYRQEGAGNVAYLMFTEAGKGTQNTRKIRFFGVSLPGGSTIGENNAVQCQKTKSAPPRRK